MVGEAGDGREAITDDGGAYRFGNVPAGEARVSVSYVGLEKQTATVRVPAGGAVQREFELVREGAPKPAAAAASGPDACVAGPRTIRPVRTARAPEYGASTEKLLQPSRTT